LVAPDLCLFLVLFHGVFVVSFKKQLRRVVVKNNSLCLPGFALAKSFSGYLSAHVLFSLSALSDS
jgi:hypothetical protein